jgi:hypothetical protein
MGSKLGVLATLFTGCIALMACAPERDASSVEAEIVGGTTVSSREDPISRSTAVLLELDRSRPGCSTQRPTVQSAPPPVSCLRPVCTAAVVGAQHLVTGAHCEHGRIVLEGNDLAQRALQVANDAPMYAGFGLSTADWELRAVEWMKPRSRMPGILSTNAIADDDLDFDFFLDWTIHPSEVSPDELLRWAVSRDVAVLSLREPVPSWVTPAVLPSGPAAAGGTLVAAGYGFQAPLVPGDNPFSPPRPEAPHDPRLRTLGVTVESASACDAPFLEVRAGAGAALCSGDSGGPLFRPHASGALEIVGVLSRGGCVKNTEPFGSATYVDLRHHFQWLAKGFAHVEKPLAIPPTPVAECAPLDGDRQGQPSMR